MSGIFPAWRLGSTDGGMYAPPPHEVWVMSEKRTPMEMSCWRGSWRKNPKGTDFRVFHGDWCFSGRVSGSELRKARKRLKAELRAANVLNRRLARFGQAIYE